MRKAKPQSKSSAKSPAKRRAKSTVDQCAQAPSSQSESVELRIEKLTNGYLVTRSTYKNGEYKSERTYSAKKPKLEASADGH